MDEEFSVIEEILAKKTIQISPGDCNSRAAPVSLLDAFYVSIDRLAGGVSFVSGGLEKLIYDRICPRLIVHGLVESGLPPGVVIQHRYLTDKGRRFAAYLDRTRLLSVAPATR